MRAERLARLVRALVPVIALASLNGARPARASPCDKRSAEAAVLFDQGKKLFDAGRWAEACERLDASQREEPSVGTLGLLAACHEKVGRLATAWEEYLGTATRARMCHDPRESFARSRAGALEPRLATLMVRAPERDSEIEVRWNGSARRLGVPGADRFVDPGHFEIIARAPGKQEFRAELDVRDGAHLQVDIPVLAPLGRPQPLPREAARPLDPGRGMRVAAFTVGGAGLAGLTLGIGGGVAAIVKKSASAPFCDDRDRCTPQGGALRDQGWTAATLSTVGFGVALAGLGAGAILFAASTPGPPAKVAAVRLSVLPVVGPAHVGAMVVGAF